MSRRYDWIESYFDTANIYYVVNFLCYPVVFHTFKRFIYSEIKNQIIVFREAKRVFEVIKV